MKLYCAFKLKLIEPPQNPDNFWFLFFERMVEEECRRRDLPDKLDVLSFLGVKDFELAADRLFADKRSRYWDIIKNITPEDLTYQCEIALDRYQSLLDECCAPLYRAMLLLHPPFVQEPLTFYKAGFKNRWNILAMYIQNQYQIKDQVRRDAFTNRRYRNPATEPEMVLFSIMQYSLRKSHPQLADDRRANGAKFSVAEWEERGFKHEHDEKVVNHKKSQAAHKAEDKIEKIMPQRPPTAPNRRGRGNGREAPHGRLEAAKGQEAVKQAPEPAAAIQPQAPGPIQRPVSAAIIQPRPREAKPAEQAPNPAVRRVPKPAGEPGVIPVITHAKSKMLPWD